MTISLVRTAAACLLLAGATTQAFAQAEGYPNKPIRIITHSAAGGAPDVLLRFVGERLGQILGQQIVVLNQPGAGGAVAARGGASATPDGYTLYMPAASAFVTLSGLQPNLPLQLPRDFKPVGFIGEQPMVLTVPASLGVSSLPEFIALAKTSPGKLSYAATGRGTMTHLTGELLKSRANIDVLSVPYTGGAPQALNDALGGRLSMVIEGVARWRDQSRAAHSKRSRPDRRTGCRTFRTSPPPPKRFRASMRAAGSCWWRRSARPTRS
jgi:tripartite-type tricarboxylate transporter receptor subunit TctC